MKVFPQIQNVLFLNNSVIVMPLPSSTGGANGTKQKYTALAKGITAQRTAIHFQFSMPASVKNNVLAKTTNTCPQQ